MLMKKIKYLNSLKNKNQQKSNIENRKQQKCESQYLKKLKTDTIQSFLQIQKEIFSKEDLNITFKRSDNPNNYYKSRSQYKRGLQKALKSSQKIIRSEQKIIKQKIFDKSCLTIKNLLKYKAQSQSEQRQRLKNPFYKIQKNRFSIKINQVKQEKQIIQDCKKFTQSTNFQKIPKLYKKQIQSNRQNSFFIPKKQKLSYLATKKRMLRTLSYNMHKSSSQQKSQISDNSKTIQIQKQKLPIQKAQLKQSNSLSQYIKKHRKVVTSIQELPPKQTIQFDKSQRLCPINNTSQDNTIIQKSVEQSPVKIRQKSLTIKYHEIKDYFEKKYVKNGGDKQQFYQSWMLNLMSFIKIQSYQASYT